MLKVIFLFFLIFFLHFLHFYIFTFFLILHRYNKSINTTKIHKKGIQIIQELKYKNKINKQLQVEELI